MSDPHPSTQDAESAPLLDHPTEEQPTRPHPWSLPARPLTFLEKGLAIASIALLLLSSVFIGLFAGTNHQLSKERHHPTQTVTTTIPGHSPTSTSPGQHPFPNPTVVPTPAPTKEVCLTKECVILASELLKSIDETVDPCEDFYAYANGGWLKSNSIPADRGSYGSFEALQISNRKVILEILEGDDDATSNSDEDPEQVAEKANLIKLRTGYKACLPEDVLNGKGSKPLKPLIDYIVDILGEFDITTTSLEQDVEVDWKGTYTEDYVIPEGLRIKDEGDLWSRKKPVGPHTSTNKDFVTLTPPPLPSNSFLPTVKDKLTAALAYTHSRGVDALLGFYLEGDSSGDDSQIQGLFFSQTGGGLPAKQYYHEKPIMDLYTEVVAAVLEAVAPANIDPPTAASAWPWDPPSKDDPVPDDDEEKYMNLAMKVVAFEKALMDAGGDPELLSNPIYSNNPYSFTNLSLALPFDLGNYLAAMTPRSSPGKIIVTYPPYIPAVNALLADTPQYILSAYFVTRISMSFSTLLGPATPVRLATRRLEVVLRGIKPGTYEDRQQFCQSHVDNIEGLGFLGGKEFVERKFGGDSKEKAEGVIYGIIDAFKARLPHLAWMDSESAKAAALKAETLLVKVGYPSTPDCSSAVALQRYYSPLVIDDDFFANGLRTRLLAEFRSWSTMGKPRDRGSWEMVPQLVNAYYSPPDGEIVFPAGILQPPFFSADWPEVLQYGAFGSVAAHELTHAFDNSGSQYDEKGLLRDWWTNSTVKGFQEKAQCIAKTYSNYSIPGPDGKPVYINGNLTNGEDLGDSGIIFAFEAWKNSIKTKETQSKLHLPGLDFSEEQLFFIATGRVWAGLMKPESALARIRTDPHSPNYWRLNGALSGFAKFAEAYNCPVGSRMNPEKRCDVWVAKD